MKKTLLLLCAFALLVISCSKEEVDVTPAPIQDQTVGTWKYYKLFRNDVEAPLAPCENQETFKSNANGTYTYTHYFSLENNCEIEEAIEGVWNNAGNGVYQYVEGTYSYNRLLTFEENTFFYTYFYEAENVTEKYVYIKQ